ncbi:MAG: pyridoxamine 5-phosphate oxidase [Blastocatellia bacterium]|jgi:pyridoxamine 5'-phosphate oxidase|nr:pyridoxamine 5-phosphate oxidase [Blastocatellia bacterium]
MTDIRERIIHDELDQQSIDPDPIKQFQKWFDDAIADGLKLPEAMTLATATRDGKPSARIVLLKQVDERGFVFFTNYRSKKAGELDDNANAAVVFYWPQHDRQVRIEGTVTKVSAEESDAYFQTRPRDSQIGALVSPQSEVISGRDILEKRTRELEEEFRDQSIQRPAHWGGYLVTPQRIEFWKARPSRLHDRIVYERQGHGAWQISRLAP